MPSMDIGIRPMSPAMTNPLTPGALNISRYGPTTGGSPLRVSDVDRTDDFAPNHCLASYFPGNGTRRGLLGLT
ncbi:hypothetical protein GCM10023075_03030 [Streptosporangium album]